MSFAKEWEDIYSASAHLSTWPWSDLVGLVHHHAPGPFEGLRVLEVGCGAGANIPFFRSLGCDYFGIDGSPSIIDRLASHFPDMKDHLAVADFTEDFVFEGPFDLVIDRGSLTHNSDADIRKAIGLAFTALRPGGRHISVDWFSNAHYGAASGEAGDDPYTRRNFKEGALNGTGIAHFSDRANVEDIFAAWKVLYLMHKNYEPMVPDSGQNLASWNIVAERP